MALKIIFSKSPLKQLHMIRRGFDLAQQTRCMHQASDVRESVRQQIMAINTNLRRTRKREKKDGDSTKSVIAYSTAEEYYIGSIFAEFVNKREYKIQPIGDKHEHALYITSQNDQEKDPKEFYLFKNGTVVFWNTSEDERNSILHFLNKHSKECYDEKLIHDENEILDYNYTDTKTRLENGTILLSNDHPNTLEKYSFSNGIALSVKLAIRESSLDRFVDSIKWMSESVNTGKINVSMNQILQKLGELFALRIRIYLHSHLLDTPDFYWDNEDLETHYIKICRYLEINRRGKIMEEKLSHCFALMNYIEDYLRDRHHCRLEWIIIILIMVEVILGIGEIVIK